MAIRGIYQSNQGIVGERVGDFASAILMVDPTGSAPMLAMTSGMPNRPAGDTIFHWFEDAHISGNTTATGGGTTTTIPVTDSSVYVPGTVLMVEDTGEYLLVDSVTDAQIGVIRGLAGTAIVAITNGMTLQNVGNAHEEGSNRPVAVAQQGAPRLNYTQIFRNGWAVTGTAKAVKFLTGSKLAKNKMDCAKYHAEDKERAILFSKKHIGTRNGKQFRMTDGLLTQIEQYGGIVESATDGTTAGNYSWLLFNDWIRRLFKKNVKGQPNERIAFCGDVALQVINNFALADSEYNLEANETELGIMITTVKTPFGKLKMMTHPLMTENARWAKELYAFHPGGIARRTLRETFEENYDTNGNRIDGVDADEGLITTEMGIECGAAQTMGILRNLNKAVVSDFT